MQGCTIVAAVLVALAAAGCDATDGADPAPAQAVLHAVPESAATTARNTEPRAVGHVSQGSFRTAQLVPVPQLSPTGAAPVRRRRAPARVRMSGRASHARFRAAQLRVLRAHCTSRAAAADPRCDGTEVNERVAFAAFEEQAR